MTISKKPDVLLIFPKTGIDFGSAVAPPHSLLTIAAPLEAYAESGWFSHPFT
jgi:hypothetical protein|tara:strand:+ start:3012 stop:3167 length:156 start_codon:yes stop_codon:yes gene_type:complete